MNNSDKFVSLFLVIGFAIGAIAIVIFNIQAWVQNFPITMLILFFIIQGLEIAPILYLHASSPVTHVLEALTNAMNNRSTEKYFFDEFEDERKVPFNRVKYLVLVASFVYGLDFAISVKVFPPFTVGVLRFFFAPNPADINFENCVLIIATTFALAFFVEQILQNFRSIREIEAIQ